MMYLTTVPVLIIASSSAALLALLLLHLVSPEFKPSWRMVSEYGLGKYPRILTFFFVTWGLSSLSTAYFLLNLVSTGWAYLGAGLICLSGIGAVFGGLFDLRHKLHGLSFVLGVPTFPIGALLVAYPLSVQSSWIEYQSTLLLSAHSVWISLVLMAAAMALFFAGLQKAGVPVGPNATPIDKLPEGVSGFNGYTNRLLIVVYLTFNLTVAIIFLIVS